MPKLYINWTLKVGGEDGCLEHSTNFPKEML